MGKHELDTSEILLVGFFCFVFSDSKLQMLSLADSS